ncbi:Ff.00g114590.m01.CDS01 [Fusarium sp. VM40]|nr:Ff.00g114590.m01.CDS01 [Fusarium sp. VM40]
MSNNEQNNDSSEYVPGGNRPLVSEYTEPPVFGVGDSVYLINIDGSQEGPYVVATAPSAGKCMLCYSDGKPFRNNAAISVDELEAS